MRPYNLFIKQSLDVEPLPAVGVTSGVCDLTMVDLPVMGLHVLLYLPPLSVPLLHGLQSGTVLSSEIYKLLTTK